MAITKIKPEIDITLKQYVDNPYRGSSFLASRRLIKQGLNSAYIEILRKYRSRFFAIPYEYQNKDILFHVKVPSEEYQFNKITYDVLFLIEYNPDVRLSQRNIKMFSNSPSFIFTYAYVYYHSNLVIDSFVQKIPTVAITQEPEIRNPIESLGYEKSTYIAARYLLDGFALTEQYIDKNKIAMSAVQRSKILANIADPEILVQIYALGREKQAKENRPGNEARTEKRKEIQTKYITKNKSTMPKKKPKAKITARKARKTLSR
jgi:hypothetical protein